MPRAPARPPPIGAQLFIIGACWQWCHWQDSYQLSLWLRYEPSTSDADQRVLFFWVEVLSTFTIDDATIWNPWESNTLPLMIQLTEQPESRSH